MSDVYQVTKVNLNEVSDYAKGIILGVVDGLESLIDMVIHPLDEIVFPITDFIFDAIVIIHQYLVDSMPAYLLMSSYSIFKYYLDCNREVYHSSLRRMQRRIDNLKETGDYLLNASGPEKLRAITSLGVTIWIPGKVFSASAAIVKNIKAFKISLPTRFYTSSACTLQLNSVQKLSLQAVRALKGKDNVLMYVINNDRELIITPQIYDHWHLGGGKHAYCAGDIQVTNGLITRIDNRSGSYAPQGSHLSNLVEHVFKQHGFFEARGKWVDFFAETAAYRSNSCNTSGITRILPSASCSGLVFGFNAKINQFSTQNLSLDEKLTAIAESIPLLKSTATSHQSIDKRLNNLQQSQGNARFFNARKSNHQTIDNQLATIAQRQTLDRSLIPDDAGSGCRMGSSSAAMGHSSGNSNNLSGFFSGSDNNHSDSGSSYADSGSSHKGGGWCDYNASEASSSSDGSDLRGHVGVSFDDGHTWHYGPGR